jgi:uncharacterized membrane protein YozB (DUF420 family)
MIAATCHFTFSSLLLITAIDRSEHKSVVCAACGICRVLFQFVSILYCTRLQLITPAITSTQHYTSPYSLISLSLLSLSFSLSLASLSLLSLSLSLSCVRIFQGKSPVGNTSVTASPRAQRGEVQRGRERHLPFFCREP